MLLSNLFLVPTPYLHAAYINFFTFSENVLHKLNVNKTALNLEAKIIKIIIKIKGRIDLTFLGVRLWIRKKLGMCKNDYLLLYSSTER